MNKKKGFTLIELLVVMAIIVILASLLIVRFSIAQKKARDATRKSDLKEIQNAIEIYLDDHQGIFPGVLPNLRDYQHVLDCSGTDLMCFQLVPKYVSRIPSDPRYSAPDPFQYYHFKTGGSKNYVLTTKLENQNEQSDCTDPAVGADPNWECGTIGPWATGVFRWTGGSLPAPASGPGIYFRLGNN